MKKLIHACQRPIGAVLVAMLYLMVLLTFTDVVGRRLFNTPVFGANDITEHLMAIIVFAGLPLLTARREHLSIDLFDSWLLRPQFRWWHKAVDGLIAAVLALVAYQYGVAVVEARETSEVSQALGIPRAGMYAFMALTSAVAALAALSVDAPKHTEITPEHNT